MSDPPFRWRRLLARASPREDRTRILSEMDELYRVRRERLDATQSARWYRRQVLAFVLARITGQWRTGPKRRSARVWGVVGRVRDAIRMAGRQLLRSPANTAVALLVLALAAGAGTAVFSIVDGVVLTPLPFTAPDRLVRVRQIDERGHRVGLAPPAHFLFERSELRTLESVAVTTPGEMDLEEVGEPENVPVAHVSAGLFGVLGVNAELGRTLTHDEDRAGAPPVVVLSHGLWLRRFGAEPSIVGRSVRLGGTARTVIGVMPSSFDFPAGTDAWLPAADELAGMEGVWGAQFLDAVARLRAGFDPAAASAELSALLHGVPEVSGYAAEVTSLHDELTAEVRRPLLVLLGAVVLVLLVACANVGSLFLARAMERRRELALRTALGATRRMLTTALLAEGILLGLVAGAIGALLAYATVDALLLFAPGDLPRAAAVRVEGRTIGFALAAGLVAGVIVGLLPASQTRVEIGAALTEGARTHTATAAGVRTRGVLLVAQTAVTMLLLAGAGLLGGSFLRLMAQETGFAPEGLMSAELNLPAHRYPTEADLLTFYDDVVERAAAIPGVESAAATRNLPMAGRNLAAPVLVPDGRRVDGTVHVSASSGFLELMRTHLVRGRSFNDEDLRRGRRPVVLSQTLARRLFADADPLGRRVVTLLGRDTMEVVGVAEDVRFASLNEDAPPLLYRPLSHWTGRGIHLVARSRLPPRELAAALQQAVREVSPDQPVKEVATMHALVMRSAARARFYALLLVAFGIMALVLSAVGLYGLLLSDVARQRREIGIRVALGARARQEAARVIGRALVLTGAGIAAGAAAALLSVRLVEGMLFGVGARDPTTLGVMVLVLLTVALLATVPAVLRVVRVDPSRELSG